MGKFINDKATIVEELLEGFALLHGDLVEVDGRMVVSRELEKADRVTIVTFGGSGHEPAQLGYVGKGMLDIQVVGDVFTAPGPRTVFEALQRADKGHGVLLFVLNHAGDMLTGNMVMKMAEMAGMNVRRIVTQEDIANAPRGDGTNRRGLAGAVPLYHIAAAAAAEGRSLDEVAALAERYANSMATVAVATKFATNPFTGESMGSLGDDEMEIGAGQHGEGGGGIQPFRGAAETVGLMARELVADIQLARGDKAFVMVDGAGATTMMELLILYKDCVRYLEEIGVEVVAQMVGEILTTQEQAGFQLSMAKWDDEFLRLWKTPALTPAFRM